MRIGKKLNRAAGFSQAEWAGLKVFVKARLDALPEEAYETVSNLRQATATGQGIDPVRLTDGVLHTLVLGAGYEWEHAK